MLGFSELLPGIHAARGTTRPTDKTVDMQPGLCYGQHTNPKQPET